MSGRYEPLRYVAVPRLLKRNGYLAGEWHEAAKKLAPGLAMQVPNYTAAKMLQRAAKQLGMQASINTSRTDKSIWVGVPE